MKKSKEIKCPICKKKFKSNESTDLPFCSERCRELDLSNWLTEGYSIPAIELDDEEVTELEKAVEKLGNE